MRALSPAPLSPPLRAPQIGPVGISSSNQQLSNGLEFSARTWGARWMSPPPRARSPLRFSGSREDPNGLGSLETHLGRQTPVRLRTGTSPVGARRMEQLDRLTHESISHQSAGSTLEMQSAHTSAPGAPSVGETARQVLGATEPEIRGILEMCEAQLREHMKGLLNDVDFRLRAEIQAVRSELEGRLCLEEECRRAEDHRIFQKVQLDCEASCKQEVQRVLASGVETESASSTCTLAYAPGKSSEQVALLCTELRTELREVGSRWNYAREELAKELVELRRLSHDRAASSEQTRGSLEKQFSEVFAQQATLQTQIGDVRAEQAGINMRIKQALNQIEEVANRETTQPLEKTTVADRLAERIAPALLREREVRQAEERRLERIIDEVRTVVSNEAENMSILSTEVSLRQMEESRLLRLFETLDLDMRKDRQQLRGEITEQFALQASRSEGLLQALLSRLNVDARSVSDVRGAKSAALGEAYQIDPSLGTRSFR